MNLGTPLSPDTFEEVEDILAKKSIPRVTDPDIRQLVRQIQAEQRVEKIPRLSPMPSTRRDPFDLD